MHDETLKEQLIQATIALINENPHNITVRQIAERAGVGVGLINYHFQTKDNLIDVAVQRIIDAAIARVPDILAGFAGTPEEKLRQMARSTMRYIASNPNVSRISILRDMGQGHAADNTQTTIRAYDSMLQGIIPDKKKRALIVHVLVASLQALFLRAGVLREISGFDFYDEEQRGRFIDALLDVLLKD
jgi:AcrR family transcriptional regulator